MIYFILLFLSLSRSQWGYDFLDSNRSLSLLFEHLARLFVTYFDNNQLHLKNTGSLFFVTQQKGESLCQYMVCFNVVILKVKNFNESIAISTLKLGLWSNQLIFSLNKKISDTYDEMLTRVRKYAQVEEEEKLNKQVRKNKNGNKQPHEEDRGDQKESTSGRS